jgi:hypothetical protein
MSKLSFLMLDRKTGERTVPVEYRPLKITVGDVNHTLALHQVAGEWRVSDPISGGAIVWVQGLYKGIPVSSKGLGVREATARARVCVGALVDRVGGPSEWNARLAHARATYAEAA